MDRVREKAARNGGIGVLGQKVKRSHSMNGRDVEVVEVSLELGERCAIALVPTTTQTHRPSLLNGPSSILEKDMLTKKVECERTKRYRGVCVCNCDLDL